MACMEAERFGFGGGSVGRAGLGRWASGGVKGIQVSAGENVWASDSPILSCLEALCWRWAVFTLSAADRWDCCGWSPGRARRTGLCGATSPPSPPLFPEACAVQLPLWPIALSVFQLRGWVEEGVVGLLQVETLPCRSCFPPVEGESRGIARASRSQALWEAAACPEGIGGCCRDLLHAQNGGTVQRCSLAAYADGGEAAKLPRLSARRLCGQPPLALGGAVVGAGLPCRSWRSVRLSISLCQAVRESRRWR